jgi:uncharacterized oxidoreductase
MGSGNGSTTQRLVVVTGSTSGIGRTLARKLLAVGDRVIACGRNKRELLELAHEFPACIPVAGDLRHAEHLAEIKNAAANHGERLDVLFNVAGIQFAYDFISNEDAMNKIEEEIATNVTAQMQLIYLMLPFLIQAERGLIVNLTSCLAVVPKKSAPVYCATKAAMRCFTRALRYQLEDTPVEVMEIVPPLVDTPMAADRADGKMPVDSFVDQMMASVAGRRPEARIGKARVLLALHRVAPGLAFRILKFS